MHSTKEGDNGQQSPFAYSASPDRSPAPAPEQPAEQCRTQAGTLEWLVPITILLVNIMIAANVFLRQRMGSERPFWEHQAHPQLDDGTGQHLQHHEGSAVGGGLPPPNAIPMRPQFRGLPSYMVLGVAKR